MEGRNVSHRLFHSPHFRRTARRDGPYLHAHAPRFSLKVGMDLPGRPRERDENARPMKGRNVSHRLFHSPHFRRTARRDGPYLYIWGQSPQSNILRPRCRPHGASILDSSCTPPPAFSISDFRFQRLPDGDGGAFPYQRVKSGGVPV